MNSVCQLLRRMNFNVSPSNLPFKYQEANAMTRCKLDDLQSLIKTYLLIFTAVMTMYQKIMSHKIIVMYL